MAERQTKRKRPDPQRGAMGELIEFQLSELRAEPGTVYLLRCTDPVSVVGDERCRKGWHQVWEKAGGPVPPLLIVDSGCDLIELSDADLLAAGLMRVPDP